MTSHDPITGPTHVSAAPALAPAWARAAALVLDGLVWMPLALAFAYASTRSPAWSLLIFPLGLIGSVTYQITMHARYGATLGKMAFGLRVVRNADLSPIDLTDSLKRSFVDALLRLGMAFVSVQVIRSYHGVLPGGDVMTFLKALQASVAYAALSNMDGMWTLAETFTCILNPRRRALHDGIAGTVVVKTR